MWCARVRARYRPTSDGLEKKLLLPVSFSRQQHPHMHSVCLCLFSFHRFPVRADGAQPDAGGQGGAEPGKHVRVWGEGAVYAAVQPVHHLKPQQDAGLPHKPHGALLSLLLQPHTTSIASHEHCIARTHTHTHTHPPSRTRQLVTAKRAPGLIASN